MPKLEYSPLALVDLQNLRDYIITNWGEKVAKRILRKITTDIRMLEENPMSGVDLVNILVV